MNTYDVTDPYGTYQTKSGEDPYSILMKMSSWNKEIRSTISDVQFNLDGTIQKQSQIIQDIDGITSTVSVIDSNLGTLESTVVQQAGLIAQKVSGTDYTGAKVTSLIVQDAASITLLAQQLNLNGLVTFTNLTTSGQTTINGGNIVTNTLSGNTIIANTLAGSKIIAGTIAADRLAVTNLAAISAHLGEIYSGTINSIQINGANINISQDVSIGNNIYLGNQNSTSTKRINFNNNTSISGGGSVTGYLALSAETLDLYNVDSVINAPMLVQSPNRTRIGLRYSSTSRRIYVDINGSEVGFMSLT